MMNVVVTVSLALSTLASLIVVTIGANSFDQLGDVNIGLVLPIHDTNYSLQHAYDVENACGDLNPSQAMLVSRFRRLVNAARLPYGLRLGFSIIDSCDLPNVAIYKATEWTKTGSTQNVHVAIGAYSSGVAAPLATYLQLYSIPLVDFGATSSDLSDKRRYPLYLRTTPPDRFQAKALVDLAKQLLNYQCVHLVFSEGLYGEGGADDVRKHLADSGLCTATEQMAPSRFRSYNHAKEFDDIVASLKGFPKTTAIICFCEDDTLIGLLSSLKTAADLSDSNSAIKYRIMASDYWGTSLPIQGLEETASGAISLSLGFQSNYRDDIGDWFSQQVRLFYQQDPWFQEYIESRFHCGVNSRDSPCNLNEIANLKRNDLPRSDPDIIWHLKMAIEAVERGVSDFINRECQQVTKEECQTKLKDGQKLYSYMRGVAFTSTVGGDERQLRFDQNGDGYPNYRVYSYHRLGKYPFYLNRYTYSTVGEWSLRDGLKLDEETANQVRQRARNQTSTCECRSHQNTKSGEVTDDDGGSSSGANSVNNSEIQAFISILFLTTTLLSVYM